MLEQIVGDIEDEFDFDETEDNILPDKSGRFRVKAVTEIGDFNEANVADFMTAHPVTIGPDELAVDAVGLLETGRKQQLLVLDASKRLVGALNMFDLLRAKVV